ncbi:MAG TPA: copper amine oxidase N-terminal domain-containing protein [Symbiobacteriaceae bacterium]|nr:copper amine oxidase N-terminal domain-containing protein [Symbiobacteriaceae bacterium]
MAIFCRRRLAAAGLVLLLALCSGTAFGADPTAPLTPEKSYKDAQYVQVLLGQPDAEEGLRLIDGLPDGLTQPSLDMGGRQSMPNQIGPERYFYFDVHDTYIHGGQNTVQVTVSYRDIGLTPIYLEYDAFDPLRPLSKADDVVKKRIVVTSRGNTEGLKTQFITLEDARFAGGQAGGADFRIFANDELMLTNVSVWRTAHSDPKPIRVTLDGKPVTYDPNEVQPFIQNNRTLVPMRATFNALGVTNENIIWHNDTRTVEAKKGDTVIALTIDDATVKVNGKVLAEKLDQPATIVAGRTVVPLRFVATQFGLKVEWNAAEQIVVLTTLPPVTAPTTPPTTTPPTTTQPSPQQPQPQPKP